MIARTALIFSTMCSISAAAIRSGKAEVDWLTTTSTYEAGKPVQTAVRLILDEHWHTYWTNPGEGGMKTSVIWELPTGWTAGELEHPLPKSFMTGDLPGYGYEGTVIFPVKFTPPADFSGTAKLKGKISWLTCNEDSCVPGNASLELTLTAGASSATAEEKLIQEALTKVPIPAPASITLFVIEKPKAFQLTLTGYQENVANLDGTQVFPTTPETIAAGAKFQFTKDGKNWVTEVPKSEYLANPLQELTLVLAESKTSTPISLTWKTK
jgi:DsbC/DsbD-like thiol-disulfide interchange protein